MCILHLVLCNRQADFSKQRRSDEVDLCEINYLGSSLIDLYLNRQAFLALTEKGPAFKLRFETGSSRGKG